jgi:hypothetical protein
VRSPTSHIDVCCNINQMQETRICQNCKQEFVIEPEDFAFYNKIKVPPTTWCPECRMVRRFAWRNERGFYHRECDLCHKKIVSIHSPSAKYPVYCYSCWWGERWDGISYGIDYDFSRPFLEQFRDLLNRVPQIALNSHVSNVDSEYVNYGVQSKNCYLCIGGAYLENVLFSDLCLRCRECMEIMLSIDCELCYELFYCFECYGLRFGKNCVGCRDSWFLDDCHNCHDCIECSGLRNASFCYRNEKLTKEDYENRKQEFLGRFYNNPNDVRRDYALFSVSIPKRFATISHSVNCTGDYIVDSKDCRAGFNVGKSENCCNCQDAINQIKDARDATSCGLNCELLYEDMVASMNSSNILFSTVVRNNSFNVHYSFGINSSSHLFGCVGLRNKQYCILNKQYTKEEYESLVPKIIKHMNDMPYVDAKGREYKYGEFFPPELSPFAYNETIAQEYFPLTKEQAIEKGYRWKDPEPRNYQITKKPSDLPDNIKDVSDSITDEIIQCSNYGSPTSIVSNCTTAFRIIPRELEFYRKMNLPLPRLCPNCRHYERLKQRNPLKLWHRKCMCKGGHFHGDGPCPNEFETSYAPGRPEIVYCEKCYQQEVV